MSVYPPWGSPTGLPGESSSSLTESSLESYVILTEAGQWTFASTALKDTGGQKRPVWEVGSAVK